MITTEINGVDTRVEFETEDETIPRKQIIIVDNIDYEVDVRLRERGVII